MASVGRVVVGVFAIELAASFGATACGIRFRLAVGGKTFASLLPGRSFALDLAPLLAA